MIALVFQIWMISDTLVDTSATNWIRSAQLCSMTVATDDCSSASAMVTGRPKQFLVEVLGLAHHDINRSDLQKQVAQA